MGTVTLLHLTLLLTTQANPPAAESTAEERAARLQTMTEIAKSYRMRPLGDRFATHPLRPEPVHRFTNTVGQTRDGSIFVWTLGETGRPAAAAQVYERRDDGAWIVEFSSLSTAGLTARSTSGHQWSPESGGVEFKAVPDAPKPASTPERRLVQMRAIARDMVAEDNFRNVSYQPLRMLTTPFLRYGKDGTDVIDGALFAFVLTTDPEVYLLLEARTGADGPAWFYAFAPSTVWGVRAKLKGTEVWSLPNRPSGGASGNPTSTFHVHVIGPAK
jgi:hypothetical protein